MAFSSTSSILLAVLLLVGVGALRAAREGNEDKSSRHLGLDIKLDGSKRRTAAENTTHAAVTDMCVLPASQHILFTETCETHRHLAASGIQLAAMQDEHESMQLLVRGSQPFTVKVESTVPFPLTWYQVGYVFTQRSGRVQGSGGGWRPDPLLVPPQQGIAVPANFSQPLWLTWHINASQPMQEKGEVLVKVNGQVAHKIPLSVQVGDVAVPSVWNASVKQLWGFQERYLEPLYGKPVPPAVLKDFKDLLYSHRVPTPAEPEDYQRQKVPIIVFPLPYVANTMPDGTELVNGNTFPACRAGNSLNSSAMDEAVAKVHAQVQDFVKKGWPYVYGYGKDEPDEQCAPLLRQAYKRFKEIPKLKIIAATNWGGDLMKPDFPMDAWVQLYHKYDEEASKKWVAAGKEMWGYHCIEPSQEHYMNLFIERPLIHSRLLFWLAAARQYTGWLYWVDNLWRSCPEAGAGTAKNILRPVNGTHTALLDFHPDSYIWCPQLTNIFANGDGYYIYPGEHGPVVSQRLQQIRDGLEDLELFRMLANKTTIAEITQPLVRSPTDWVDRPIQLLQLRTTALVKAGGIMATKRKKDAEEQKKAAWSRVYQASAANKLVF